MYSIDELNILYDNIKNNDLEYHNNIMICKNIDEKIENTNLNKHISNIIINKIDNEINDYKPSNIYYIIPTISILLFISGISQLIIILTLN